MVTMNASSTTMSWAMAMTARASQRLGSASRGLSGAGGPVVSVAVVMVSPRGVITPKEAHSFINTGVWPDDSALKLICQDAERAEKGEQSRAWIMAWQSASTLYQSPFAPRYWPGTQSEAASISFFTVACAVNGINPQALAGLFYENPPFMIQERSGTTAQAARAV